MRKLYATAFQSIWFLFSLITIIMMIPHPGWAQPVPTVQDCLGAIPVCQETYYEEDTYTGSGNYPNEIFNPGGDCTLDCPGSCLDGEQNSVWYVFTVQSTGNLRMIIDPVDDNDDYDWAVYDITWLRCDNIFGNYQQMQKSCNAWGATGFNGPTGISSANGGISNCNHCGDATSTRKWNLDLPVTAGSTYVLVIENWGTDPTGGYLLDFSESTASIFDDVRPMMIDVFEDDLTCGSNTILVDFSENVECESVDPTDFILSGPGGPYTVTDVTGFACELGAEMESQYLLTFQPSIREDGDYSIQLTPLSFVFDACGNFALGNTISFNVSLGGPVINEFTMEINSATCGLSNGSITGIGIIGSGTYTYLWTNDAGDTVGTDLDLIGVPSGNYILLVTDQNTCAASGGPYFVDQTGAPSVVDAAMTIQSATFGANNGSITGIQAEGTEPLSFVWMDDASNVVGNTLDLLNVYTGLYSLTVTDANNCDTVAGPYFVPEIGGPVVVTATADPGEICIGEGTQLNALASGGTGIYTFTWTSDPAGFNSDLQNPTVFPLVTTTYTVDIFDGYIGNTGQVTVTVHPLPLANAGTDITIPYGTSTTLFGDATGGSGNYYYSWEPESLLILSDVQNPPTKNLYENTFFYLTVTDLTTNCISLKDTVIVLLSGGALAVSLIADDDSICTSQTTTIHAYGTGGNFPDYTFTWYEGGNQIKVESGETSSLAVSSYSVGTHIYEVEINDGFNTFLTEIHIEVLPSPEFTILGGPQIIACPYDSVILSPDQFFAGADYYWSNGSVEPTQKIGTTGIGFDSRTYSLTITTDEGCMYSSDIEVIFDFSVCFGIDENDPAPLMRVYPNPASGLITLEFEDGGNYDRMVLLNPVGQAVFIKDISGMDPGFNQFKIDLGHLPKGIYLLEAVNQRFIHHHKIILE